MTKEMELVYFCKFSAPPALSGLSCCSVCKCGECEGLNESRLEFPGNYPVVLRLICLLNGGHVAKHQAEAWGPQPGVETMAWSVAAIHLMGYLLFASPHLCGLKYKMQVPFTGNLCLGICLTK